MTGKGWIRCLLFWLSSNFSPPLMFWPTPCMIEKKTFICTIFFSCLKSCFIVQIPPDVAVAQNEAPIRSLISSHNKGMLQILTCYLEWSHLSGVLLFILFFLFSFLCPVFTDALFVNFDICCTLMSVDFNVYTRCLQFHWAQFNYLIRLDPILPCIHHYPCILGVF